MVQSKYTHKQTVTTSVQYILEGEKRRDHYASRKDLDQAILCSIGKITLYTIEQFLGTHVFSYSHTVQRT